MVFKAAIPFCIAQNIRVKKLVYVASNPGLGEWGTGGNKLMEGMEGSLKQMNYENVCFYQKSKTVKPFAELH